MFGRQLLDPAVAITGRSVYVARQVSPADGVVRSELARVDPASGQIEAARLLGAAFGQAVSAGGALWVAVKTPPAVTLLRLSPPTGALLGQRSGGDHDGAVGLLATAGDDGRQASRQLAQLLRFKAAAQYDPAPMSATEAEKAVELAARLAERAAIIVTRTSR